MAIPERQLQIKLEAGKAPLRRLANGKNRFTRVEKNNLVTTALQLSREIAHHVRNATNGLIL